MILQKATLSNLTPKALLTQWSNLAHCGHEAAIGLGLLLVEGIRAFQMSFSPLLIRRAKELQGVQDGRRDVDGLAILWKGRCCCGLQTTKIASMRGQ